MAYTTIDNPELYFQIKNYTGNETTRSITLDGSEDMAPDLVWLKGRSFSDNHVLFDSVRGALKYLNPDGTAIEGTTAAPNLGVTAFNSDGFSLGIWSALNRDAETHVAWCWKAGTTSGITTTGADITPTAYSFNHTSRFSIAAYTGNGSSGAKIAHGLGAIPEMMIIKPRDRAGQAWVVYHHKNTSAPQTDYLALDATDATADGAWPWNDAVPTSVYLETQSNNGTNASDNTFVLYTFRGVQGYSKFGSYIGNGNADGTFVYTGFKPKMLLVKSTASGGGWYIIPSKTDWLNGDTYWLYPYSTTTESNAAFVDFHANGFKLRKNDDINNAATYVYMAFAEAPFVNSEGVPCNAR